MNFVRNATIFCIANRRRTLRMLQNFTFRNPTTMVFGKDTELQVGELVKQYSD